MNKLSLKFAKQDEQIQAQDVASFTNSYTNSSRSTRSDYVRRTNQLKVQTLVSTTFLNQYCIIDTIGQGNYGKVKLCLNLETQELNAMKLVDKNSQKFRLKLLRKRIQSGTSTKIDAGQAENTWKREAEIMTTIEKHPNVVKLYEVIDDPQNDKVCLVMEFIDGGPVFLSEDMDNPKARLGEDLSRNYIIDIVNGLKYLHQNNIVHGDIKPTNVLLSYGRVCIGDFGSARIVNQGDILQEITPGTPGFLAPERMRQNNNYDGFKADVWAVGITLYIFIFAKLPDYVETLANGIINATSTMTEELDNMDTQALQETLEQTQEKIQLDFPEDSNVSDELKDLLQSILKVNSKERLTLDEILQHPWVSSKSWSLNASQQNPQRYKKVRSLQDVFYSLNPHTKLKETMLHQQTQPIVLKVLYMLNFKTIKFQPGETILHHKDKFKGLYYFERGTVILVRPKNYLLQQLMNIDNDFLEDNYGFMETLHALVDDKIMQSVQAVRDALKGVIQTQLKNFPEQLRELQQRLEKFEIQDYDVSEDIGKLKVPNGFMFGSIGDEKSLYRIPFDLITKDEVTIKFISKENIQKHLKEYPEDFTSIVGANVWCRSEYIRRVFLKRVIIQKELLRAATRQMDLQNQNAQDSGTQTLGEDFKVSQAVWQNQKKAQQHEGIFASFLNNRGTKNFEDTPEDSRKSNSFTCVSKSARRAQDASPREQPKQNSDRSISSRISYISSFNGRLKDKS